MKWALKKKSRVDLLRFVGGYVALFSLVMGLLLLFVIPSACSFLGAFQLLLLTLLFLGGVAAYLSGQIMHWVNGRGGPTPFQGGGLSQAFLSPDADKPESALKLNNKY